MKKIRLFIVLIFVCLLTSCSSSNAQVIKYDMLNDYNYFVISTYETYIEYQDTLLDKKVNYKEFGFVDKYDESFFSNNDLIILNCNETSGSNKLSYKSHELVGNSFTVNIKRKHSYNIESTDIKVWTFFITIENDQARQINSVFTNINGELKQIRNFDIFE